MMQAYFLVIIALTVEPKSGLQLVSVSKNVQDAEVNLKRMRAIPECELLLTLLVFIAKQALG
jgi:hypothetical protein